MPWTPKQNRAAWARCKGKGTAFIHVPKPTACKMAREGVKKKPAK